MTTPDVETRRIADAIRKQLAALEVRGVALIGETHLGRIAAGHKIEPQEKPSCEPSSSQR